MSERKKTLLQITIFLVVIVAGFGTWFYFLQNRNPASPALPMPLNLPMESSRIPVSPETILNNPQTLPSADPAKLPADNPAALRPAPAPAPAGQSLPDAKNKAHLSVVIPVPQLPAVKVQN